MSQEKQNQRPHTGDPAVVSSDLLECKTYQVCITETLELVKEVEASSAADAVAWVQALYRAGEIVLTADNANADYKIETL